MKEKLVKLNNINIVSKTYNKDSLILENLCLEINEEEVFGIIGKTGSGKTMIGKLLINLLPKNIILKKGTILFKSSIIQKYNNLRGNIISMIFQDPLKSLNPLQTIKKQFSLLLKKRFNYKKNECIKNVEKSLEEVQLSNVIDKYPHQLSGGQIQRVMIAMAISIKPRLIIADEITTALDANLKFEIIKLLNDLRRKTKTSIILITHDLILAKQICNRIAVLKKGTVIELNTAKKIFNNPKHPYTKKLIKYINNEPISNQLISYNQKNNLLLKVNNINKTFGSNKVLKNISLSLYKGKTLGIIGESGSGKSTLAKIILNILNKDSGEISLIDNKSNKHILNKPTNKISVVFQDTYSSLNPRMIVNEILLEPLNLLNKSNKQSRIIEILNKVELKENLLHRLPHEVSGGQRQRISIARSLLAEPKIIILDEPTSSLDADVQNAIIKLLLKIQTKDNLTYLFISHDINVINQLSHTVAIMYKGEIIETGLTKTIFKNPEKQYTKNLIKSTYNIDFLSN